MQGKFLKILFYVMASLSVLSIFVYDVLIDLKDKAPTSDIIADIVLVSSAVIFGYLAYKVKISKE
jgi:hypothetical protein